MYYNFIELYGLSIQCDTSQMYIVSSYQQKKLKGSLTPFILYMHVFKM